jgi:hypothetical protein
MHTWAFHMSIMNGQKGHETKSKGIGQEGAEFASHMGPLDLL